MESAGSVNHSSQGYRQPRRRVLIIVQNLPVPFDRRVWLESTSLTKAGYEVSVICPKMKGLNRSCERLEDVDIYRYPLPINAQSACGYLLEFGWCLLWSWWLSFRVALFGRGFDVIHACNPPETFWLLGRFWKLWGKKFVFDHHDLSPEMYCAKFERTGGFAHRILLWLEKQSFRAADLVLTTNESHRAIAIERGGKSPEDVYVVRSGPDVDRFQVYPANSAYKQGKKFLLVYLGEICKQDGVDHLIHAVRQLRGGLQRQDFHCIVVGGGPHQQSIRELAVAQGVDDVCSFTGRVSDDDLCRILSSADVAVDPDPQNSWSDKSTMNKIMEYMYFGLPIASYDLTEARFSAQEAAVYAEPNRPQALAAAIDGLLNDEAQRQRMSEFGATRLRQVLAWEHSVPALLEAYHQLCGGPKPTDPARETSVPAGEFSTAAKPLPVTS